MLSQGTVKKGGGESKLYAWGVSILAHVTVLAVFGAVKSSHKNANAQQSPASISISRAGQLSRLPMVVPKPKVVSENRAAVKTEAKSESQIIKPKQITIPNYQTILSTDEQKEQIEFSNANETQTARAEFFGSAVRGRRICYVVDCSGSMQGLWHRVRSELIESISQLEADQYFSVIAFGESSVRDSGGGKMLRASEQTKNETYDFIDSLRPAGTTNAFDAIHKALRMRDDTGTGPAVIYFLTDGFELSEQDSMQFEHRIMITLRSFSPKTQIHTIGFWPNEQDKHTLERIAKESGGEFVIVNDGYAPGGR